jgi:hypothetical protein
MYNKDEDLIGCTVEEAIFVLDSIGAPHRIVARDGEDVIVTRDAVSGRYNLEVAKGRVVGYSKED